MKKQLFKKMKRLNNSGFTMVEVLVGFTILMVVLTLCTVHMINTAGNMVMKARDMQSAREKINEELYQKNAVYETMADTTVTLKSVTKKSDGTSTVSTDGISLSADVKRFYDSAADLAIIHIDRKEDTDSAE